MNEKSEPQRDSTTEFDAADDHRTLRTTATPMEVWQAWAEPQHVARWFADDARGAPEPGGELVHVFDRFGMEMPYRVLAAEPGERLLLEGRTSTGQAFRQEVVIEREGGETVLHLLHSGFGDPDADFDDEYEGMDSGWKLAFGLLRHYLEEHFGEDRQVFFAMRPADFEYDDLQPYFRTADGLAGWLTTGGELAGKTMGDPVRLDLACDAGGGTLNGRLLADSGRELALSWEEIDGALEIKAFDMGPRGRAVCLRGCGWGMSREDAQRIEGEMETALDRLVSLLRVENK